MKILTKIYEKGETVKAQVCLLVNLWIIMFAFPFVVVKAESSDLYALPAGAIGPGGSLVDRALLSSVNPNQTLKVSAGEMISLTINYEIWQGSNPSERDQLLLIFSWTPVWPPSSGYCVGIYDGVPTAYPGYSGDKVVEIQAPSVSGTYYIWFCFGANYGIDKAAEDFKEPLSTPAHIKIIVESSGISQSLVTFTGVVKASDKGLLSVQIQDLFYPCTLKKGDIVNVYYDSDVAGVYLGKPLLGDLIQVIGKVNEKDVYVTSKDSGIINLKYLNEQNIKNQLTSSERISFKNSSRIDLPIDLPVIGSHVIGLEYSFELYNELDLSVGCTSGFYGISRRFSPGLLTLDLEQGDGKYIIGASLQLSVYLDGREVGSKNFPYEWTQTFALDLGQSAQITFFKAPIPAIDIGIAKLNVKIGPIVTFKPTKIGSQVDTDGSLTFVLGNGNFTDISVTWVSKETKLLPLMFLEDGRKTINMSNSYMNYESEFIIDVDTTLEIPLMGEVELAHFSIPIDKRPGTKILKSDFDVATFIPHYFLTIDTPKSGTIIKINAVPYPSDNDAVVVTLLPQGSYNLETSSLISISEKERYVFLSWDDGTQSNNTKIELSYDKIITALYKLQYYVKINSHVPVIGGGWYNNGTIAEISANETVPIDTRSRYKFQGWTGDINNSNTTAHVKVDNPLNITAQYIKQYKVNVQSEYSLAVIKEIGTSSGWIDEGSTITFTVQEREIFENFIVQRSFSGWINAETQSSLPDSFAVNGPINAIAVWKTEYINVRSLGLVGGFVGLLIVIGVSVHFFKKSKVH
jgi:hypothetical protein